MVLFPGDVLVLFILLFGLIVMTFDFIKHKRLAFVFYAYYFIFLAALLNILASSGQNPLFEVLKNGLGVMLAGWWFATGAYKAHKRMHHESTRPHETFNVKGRKR